MSHLLLMAIGAGPFLAAVVIASLGSGVTAGELLKYLAYEIALVGLPGFALGSVLCPRDSVVFRVVSGFVIGHAVEVLGFLALAALGYPTAYPLVPLGLLLAAGAVAWRRRLAWFGQPSPEGMRSWLAIAGALLVVYTYVLVAFATTEFGSNPVPERAFAAGAPRVAIHSSLLFHMGDAAEIKHRWPIEDIRISGERYGYHYFAFVHHAAVSRITGVALPVLLLRLVPIVLMALIVWELYATARELTGSAAVGVLAAAGNIILIERLVAGEISEIFFNDPGHVLGFALFVPMVAHIHRLLTDEEFERGRLAIVTLLMAAAAGTKAVILPVVVLAVMGYGVLSTLQHRRLDRRSLIVGAMAGVVLLASVAFYTRGGSIESGSQWIEPFFEIRDTSWSYQKLYPRLRVIAGSLLGGGVVFRAVDHAAAVFALGVELLHRYAATLPAVFALAWWWKAPETLVFWLAMLFAAGAAFGYSVANWWHGQLKFLLYGHVALVILAGLGLRLLWSNRHRRPAIEVAWLVSVLLIIVPVAETAERHARRVVYRMTETAPIHGPLTKGLYEGLVYLRDSTPRDAVVVVNRVEFRHSQIGLDTDPYQYYSAFSERRFFFEGWANTGKHQAYLAETVRRLGHEMSRADAVREARRRAPDPFPERTSVILLLLAEQDPAAFARLARQHRIDYLLVDKVNGGAFSPPEGSTRLLFSNADVSIYAILTNRRADAERRGAANRDANPVYGTRRW